MANRKRGIAGLQKCVALAFGVVMVLAAWWSCQLAYADTLAAGSSPERVMQAIRLFPGNADYWLRWADLGGADSGGALPGGALPGGAPPGGALPGGALPGGADSGGALPGGTSGLERAALANPHNASLWIRAGLRAEAAADLPRAEQHLLRAARESRKYEPRWTLANFYFRRNDAGRFWPWARTALDWAPGSRAPLFTLCWGMSQDPGTLLQLAISDSAPVLRDYLGFLLTKGRLAAAEPVAAKLQAHASREDQDLLLAYTGRMLEARHWPAASSAWNALCRRRVIPYPMLDPRLGPLVTNGEFQHDSLNAGFDWRLPAIEGVRAERSAAPPSLRIAFSGAQPEACETLSQFVPIAPGVRYRLRCNFETEDIPSESGLRWKLLDAETGAEVVSLPLQQGPAAGVTFTTPPGTRAARLVLAYRRPRGTPRMEGSVRVLQAVIEPAP